MGQHVEKVRQLSEKVGDQMEENVRANIEYAWPLVKQECVVSFSIVTQTLLFATDTYARIRTKIFKILRNLLR